MYNLLKHLRFTSLFLTVLLISLSFADFNEDWNSSTSQNFYYGSGGNQAPFTHTIGADSPTEPGTKILSLKTDPEDNAGAWQGPNMTSNDICHFGTYAARIKVPDASIQPKVGAVVGFYTYYNDEYGSTLPADENNNGLHDNSEIDFEWLIADPTVIYVTAYTDYHGPTGEARKVSRIINMAQGIIYETKYAETLGGTGTSLAGAENQPSTIEALPDYDASSQFYTYGFNWYSDNIRWWMINPANSDTIVLWDYKGPQERITQKKAYLMLNIWHTSGWSVHTIPGTIEKPEHQFEVEFDWVSYTAGDNTPVKMNSTPINNKEVETLFSNQQLNIKYSSTFNTPKIDIYNLNGKLIRSIVHNMVDKEYIKVPLKGLAKGFYTWAIKTDTDTFKGSFLIK